MNEHEPHDPVSIEELVAGETQRLGDVFAVLRARFNVTSPDALPLDDDDIADALEDQGEWTVDVDKLAARMGTHEAAEEANYLKTAFFVIAGFTDRLYLIEVLDWLDQDEQRASEMGLDKISAKIRAKIEEIVALVDKD